MRVKSFPRKITNDLKKKKKNVIHTFKIVLGFKLFKPIKYDRIKPLYTSF